MQIPHLINLFHADMTAWRHGLHAHPELGFEEHRTSEFVASKLAEFGCEVQHRQDRRGWRSQNRQGSLGRTARGYGCQFRRLNDLPDTDRQSPLQSVSEKPIIVFAIEPVFTDGVRSRIRS